jgi:hypothetical protein
VAEDTFWLPTNGWAFVLGTNAVDGTHVSSSGTLSFGVPKGSPRAAAMPDGTDIGFLAALQGPLGTVPPQGRFWHAPTPSNSVLLTWQNAYAGRDADSPVTVQAELFWNGDFAYRYAFANALPLTNFVIGAQHGGGGETFALDDASRLANGLELRWRAFGALDPGIDDHDGDGLSTYDEVMLYGTNPALKDSDRDGPEDAAELAAGTDPLDADTDGDGLPDGIDPQPGVWNDPAATNGLDTLSYLYKVRHGLDPAADSSLDSDGDGWADWKELMAGTATNDFAVTPQNADGSCRLFDATFTLNEPLPCNALLRVGGLAAVLRQAGSFTLTLAEGVAHPVSVSVPRPCKVSLSVALGSQYAAFQDPGGVFSAGGAAVPGGSAAACGVIAQPTLDIRPGTVCFHAGHPKTVSAKVSPAMAGTCAWQSDGTLSAQSGRFANVSRSGNGASYVTALFTAEGAALPRVSVRQATVCARVGDSAWCRDHRCEHWYCACDGGEADGGDDCEFHGRKVSECLEAICPEHNCPYDKCPAGWCHLHRCLYSDCDEWWCHTHGCIWPECEHEPEDENSDDSDADPGEPVFVENGAGYKSLAAVNNDDDDAGGADDLDEAPVGGENDLAAVWPLGRFDGRCCPCPEHRVPPEGSHSAQLESCSARLAIHADACKSNAFGTVVHAGEAVWVEGRSASGSVGADRIVWKWTVGDHCVWRVTNAFTVLSVRLFGDANLDGEVNADDKALHPALSHEYGWRMPAATNVFRPIRLRTRGTRRPAPTAQACTRRPAAPRPCAGGLAGRRWSWPPFP